MNKAIRITTDNKVSVLSWPDEGQMQWMRKQVGGHIEIVHPKNLNRPYVMIVDEEGLMKDDPKLNVIASVLYGYLDHGEPIVGDVLILREKVTDEGLDLDGISKEEASRIKARLCIPMYWPRYRDEFLAPLTGKERSS